MPTIILDANALMMAFQFNINVTAELERLFGVYEAVVPSSVLLELEGLARENRLAAMALELAGRFGVAEVSGQGDDGVVEAAVGCGGIVVTNDKGLRRRLRSKGLQTAFMRGKNRLELDGDL